MEEIKRALFEEKVKVSECSKIRFLIEAMLSRSCKECLVEKAH